MDGASTSSDSDTGPLQLSAKETEVLSLYEHLHETRLEIALLKAQQSYKSSAFSVNQLRPLCDSTV
jgi:hypothetical protein